MSISAARPVSREKVLPLTLDEAWDLISDTEHLNRMIQLPAVDYGPVQEDLYGVPYRFARGRLHGFIPLEWREYPFEWIRPQGYRVRRLFSGGPFKEMLGGVELSAGAGGTRVRVFATLTGANKIGEWLTDVVAVKGCADTLAYAELYALELRRGNKNPLPRLKSGWNEAAAQPVMARIRSQPEAHRGVLDALSWLLQNGTDEEVQGMQPFVLADRWGSDRTETLRLFLFAAREGLLELEWTLMCPNCRVAQAQHPTLGDLLPEVHCEFCGVNYEADLDRYTELRFHVSPQVRKARRDVYCLGGPVNTPHILVQQLLLPQESRELVLDLPERLLQWRVLRKNAKGIFRAEKAPSVETVETVQAGEKGETVPEKPGSAEAAGRKVETSGATTAAASAAPVGESEFVYDGEAWLSSAPVFAGRQRMRIENSGAQPILAALERVEWSDAAVTAARVTTMQEFRALFSSEALAPGRQVAVRRLTVLFTDLKGSTALYENVGDAPAFGRVRRHFDFLALRIRECDGAVVKTIGDAVMAAFLDPVDALRAALRCQREVGALNAELKLNSEMVIKIGFHEGPTIAVNANGLLDYFGRTVNIAARIQNESRGGDIVLARELLEQEPLRAELERAGVTLNYFETELKGINGHFPLVRVELKS